MTSAAEPAPAPGPRAAGPLDRAAGPVDDVHLDADGNVAVLTLDRPAKLIA